MVYSYRYGFSGFAAKLTSSQAKQIRELPVVVRVMQNNFYKPHTSRSWDFLGLPERSPNNILNQTNQGDGVIIGIIDSGIWGDSEAFNDHGLGPIPSRWKGVCKSEGNFSATKHCNRKIIGARWYARGFMEEMKNQTMFEKYNNVSALDEDGHGTHCASTAAGSYVNNVNFYDLNMGTVRGGAPLARLAIYKVLWKINDREAQCVDVDVLAAIDDAIKDGVDVLSASLTRDKIVAEVHEDNGLGLGSFHAVSHGISVVACGGNAGPYPYTIDNTSPWIVTVAASNSDRDIVTPLTLGNNETILGQGLFKRRKSVFAPLIIFVNMTMSSREEVKSIANEVKGKVLMLFLKGQAVITTALANLATTEVLALIVATSPSDQIIDFNQELGIPIPLVSVNLDQGYQIWNYFLQCKSNNQDPMIKLGRLKLLKGKHNVALKVSKFSSRGPNPFAPDILKPDVAAPGVNILAAMIPSKGDNGFQVHSGTSMAAPHISGIVALLKVAHPDWSPAAVKSALVTTAWNKDTYRSVIYSEGTEGKIADPFDFGGGIVNANGATDPGLIYDMDKKDYLTYLCSLGYSNDMVYNATKYFSIKNKKKIAPAGIVCPSRIPSRLNLNLPSISIPNLKNSVTIKRRVTNVGNVNSVYKLVVKPPRNTAIKVTPHVLKFNSKKKKISFEVKITSTLQETSKYDFGSLGWTDGKHFVRIPIAVRKQFAG